MNNDLPNKHQNIFLGTKIVFSARYFCTAVRRHRGPVIYLVYYVHDWIFSLTNYPPKNLYL